MLPSPSQANARHVFSRAEAQRGGSRGKSRPVDSKTLSKDALKCVASGVKQDPRIALEYLRETGQLTPHVEVQDSVVELAIKTLLSNTTTVDTVSHNVSNTPPELDNVSNIQDDPPKQPQSRGDE